LTNRIHIDAPTGVIEVEGEKEFVEAQLDKLMPLIQACGFGTRPTSQTGQQDNAQNSVVGDPASSPTASEGVSQDGKKKPKRSTKIPPKGQSCADRITVLRNEGFFKTKKTPAEIAKGLEVKGWHHTTSQAGAAAVNMFKRDDLQRTKDGKAWVYFWDRD